MENCEIIISMSIIQVEIEASPLQELWADGTTKISIRSSKKGSLRYNNHPGKFLK